MDPPWRAGQLKEETLSLDNDNTACGNKEAN